MRTATKKKIQTMTSALTDGTATSPPATVSDPSPSVSASAVTAASTASALPTEPPDIEIYTPPSGFVPVVFGDYRGSFPKAGQITALPGAIIELKNSTSYDATFGPAVPSASKLAAEFTIASSWTSMRVKIEALLLYVRSNEAITWKSSLADLDKLNSIFQVVANQNPVLIAEFPELAKLLEVPKVLGKRAAATRARKTKAEVKALKSAAATPATGANAAPAVSPSTATGGSGGATH